MESSCDGQTAHDASSIVFMPSLHFEVKAVEALNVWKAMQQAIEDAGVDKIPVLAHKRNRSGWLVTMRAEDWLDIIHESDRVQGGDA